MQHDESASMQLAQVQLCVSTTRIRQDVMEEAVRGDHGHPRAVLIRHCLERGRIEVGCHLSHRLWGQIVVKGQTLRLQERRVSGVSYSLEGGSTQMGCHLAQGAWGQVVVQGPHTIRLQVI